LSKANSFAGELDFDKIFGISSPKSPSPLLEYSKRVSVTFEKPRRKRSMSFYLAREALLLVADGGRAKLDLEVIVVHFENWMARYTSGRFIKLVKEGKWLFFRCVNRFMKAYKRKIWNKMRFLDKIEWHLKIEFTVDPKRFMLLEHEFRFVSRGWSRLRSWMLKKYGKFEFLKVLEVQKSGRPHLHVLISGILYIDHRGLSEIWRKYGGGFVWIKSVIGNINAIWYVLKYVNKTILGNDRVYSALLFASNCRMFSMSQGLMGLLNVKRYRKSKGWTFEGTVSEGILREFCDGEDLPFSDCVSVDVLDKYSYDYPLLCGYSEG